MTRHWSVGAPEGPRWQHAWKEQGLASSHARDLLGWSVGARCAGRFLATPANCETWVSSSGSLAVKIAQARQRRVRGRASAAESDVACPGTMAWQTGRPQAGRASSSCLHGRAAGVAVSWRARRVPTGVSGWIQG